MINLKNKKVVTEDLEELDSFIGKSLGLLKSSHSRSLLFTTRFGIHTFGLKQPIDVVILDSQKKVVTLKPTLKPNSFFFWNPKFNLVLELPSGSIKASQIQIGDTLNLI